MDPETVDKLQTNPKRETILDQATRTFAAEGFRNADVQVIADKAGVGKGTVYRYFGNKEDLFWAVTANVDQKLGQRLLEAIGHVDSPPDKLRAAGEAFAEFFESNPDYLEVFVLARAEFRGSVPPSHRDYHEEMSEKFHKVVERGIAEGVFRPVDVRKTIVSLAAVVHGAVMFGCYWKDEYTLTELTAHAVDAFLEGIRAKPSVNGHKA